MREDARRVHEAIRMRETAILPLGGYLEDFGGHKGSRLALVVGVTCSVPSGAA
jgi:LDH2 family malate/lactate/ureidoglycolate dehydrogenase